MDNTKYAFVDEFGAFGYDFSNSGCTTHFIISAIIVDRDNLQIVADGKWTRKTNRYSIKMMRAQNDIKSFF